MHDAESLTLSFRRQQCIDDLAPAIVISVACAAEMSRIGVHPASSDYASDLADQIGQSSFSFRKHRQWDFEVAAHFVLHPSTRILRHVPKCNFRRQRSPINDRIHPSHRSLSEKYAYMHMHMHLHMHMKMFMDLYVSKFVSRRFECTHGCFQRATPHTTHTAPHHTHACVSFLC